jgi:N-methylhydantoinase B/oxoprolinase/acetone carboxylase alpha subunit
MLFHRRELLADSGGAGRFRGGLGGVIEVGHRHEEGFRISAATFDRRRFAARGRAGGQAGRAGASRRSDGTILEGKGVHEIPAGQRVIIELPGGGGWGEARFRASEAVARDLSAGLLSPEAAKDSYAHAVNVAEDSP